jgi:hypothetical protein
MIHNCKICKKIYNRKDMSDRHMNGKTLCIKTINCKELYLEHEQLKIKYNTDTQKLEDENNELKDTLDQVLNEYNEYRHKYSELKGKSDVLDIQMKEVLQSKNGGITNINNGIILISNPVTFDKIKWDTSEIDMDFIRRGTNGIIEYILKHIRIGDNIYNYCNTDSSRNNFSKLTDNLTYERDVNGNALTQDVLINVIKPSFDKALAKEYPGYPDREKMMKSLSVKKADQFHFDAKMSVYPFEQNCNAMRNAILLGLRRRVYMSKNVRNQLKFNKDPDIQLIENGPIITEIQDSEVDNVDIIDIIDIIDNREPEEADNGETEEADNGETEEADNGETEEADNGETEEESDNGEPESESEEEPDNGGSESEEESDNGETEKEAYKRIYARYLKIIAYSKAHEDTYYYHD